MIASRFRPPFLLSALLLSLAAAPAAGQGMPARLTDEGFWDLVDGLSEPTGVFASENFTSNEIGAPWVIPSLLRRAPAGGAYLGVGPEQNFTYIAALRPKIAFIVDIRRQAMLQQLLYKALFELAPDRGTFLSLLFARPRMPGRGDSASAATLLAASLGAPRDDSLFARTEARLIDHLVRIHGFALSGDDQETIRHIYRITFLAGPHLSYTSGRAIGRGAPPAPGSRSRLVVTYPKGDRGTTDTVRYLVTTSATGWVDSVRIVPEWRDQEVSGPEPAPRVPDRGDSALTMAAALEQLLRTTPRPTAPIGSGTGVADFASLAIQTDSTGVAQGFLASEAAYARVREMQLRNLIVPVVGDFAGRVAVRGIGAVVRGYGLKVSAFYVSNVEEYLFQGSQWRAFYENVATLPVDSGSTFIRAFLGGGARVPRHELSPRVDLALGSMTALLEAFTRGALTRYTDLVPLSRW